MEVLHDKAQARAWVLEHRFSGRSVGLVPTMGALHAGHFSLAQRSSDCCDVTIATIFVNPTQFGPGEDLSRYPRTLEQDLQGLEAIGTDAVFVPEVSAMYREGHSTYVQPPAVAARFEGAVRPDHFRGVTTVVLKLMQILPATHAFFGQKDYQQAAVILAMVKDLDIDMEIQVCPIVRDSDGLALSSRNRYLSPEDRSRALGLSQALAKARQMILQNQLEVTTIESAMRDVLSQAKVDAIDYAVITDGETLEWIPKVVPGCVALVAARVGTTRLIDNWLWQGELAEG